VSVTDESVQGYGPAIKDEEQDVMLKNSSIDGNAGTLIASFSRPLKAAHKHSDRSLSGCRTWQVGHTTTTIRVNLEYFSLSRVQIHWTNRAIRINNSDQTICC
jgi:hypothetical protein